MPKCAYCGTETQLYENGVPVCRDCAENPERRRKFTETHKSQPPSETDD